MTVTEVEYCLAPRRDAERTWNQAIFDELRTVLGDEKADSILSSFWLDLCRRFENACDGERLRQDAHIVKSTAGLLGFESLEEAARKLETACIQSQPFAALAEALAARRQEVGEVYLLRKDQRSR